MSYDETTDRVEEALDELHDRIQEVVPKSENHQKHDRLCLPLVSLREAIRDHIASLERDLEEAREGVRDLTRGQMNMMEGYDRLRDRHDALREAVREAWEEATHGPTANLEFIRQRLSRALEEGGEGGGWSWWWRDGEIKRCPRCGENALEGEVGCGNCGLEPEDDTTWRETRRRYEEKHHSNEPTTPPDADEPEGEGREIVRIVPALDYSDRWTLYTRRGGIIEQWIHDPETDEDRFWVRHKTFPLPNRPAPEDAYEEEDDART